MAFLSDEETAAYRDTLREYLRRRHEIENEIVTLREDAKALDEEFKDKLDMRTLRLAMSIARAKSRIAHKYTFDEFIKVIEDEGWVEK